MKTATSRALCRRISARSWILGLLLPMILAAACLAAAAMGEVRLASKPSDALSPDQMVNLCISVRLAGTWRAAAWWEPAISNRTGRLRRPFAQRNMACGLIPWQGWLPSTGELETSN